MSWFFAALTALTSIASFAPTAALAARQIDGHVTVRVDETAGPVLLGQSLDVVVTVTNTATAPTPPLVVHIDITDPAGDGSVDPEDWTATLSKPIGALDGAETRTVDWRIQPISGGSFTLYAVALSSGIGDLAASNAVTIDVTDQRSLNPDEILPVAIGTPALVGALLIVQVRRSRRSPAVTVPVTATGTEA